METLIYLTDKTKNQVLKATLEEPWGMGTLLVGSSSSTSEGIGNLLKIPYEDLVAIQYSEEGFSIEVMQREKTDLFECYDIVFIGSLEEWAKENNIALIKDFEIIKEEGDDLEEPEYDYDPFGDNDEF